MRFKNNKHSFASITIVVLSIVLFVVCMNVCSHSGLSYTAGDSSVTNATVNNSERSDTTSNGDTSPNKSDSPQADIAYETTTDKYGNKMLAHEVILTFEKDMDEEKLTTELETNGYKVKETLSNADDEYGSTVSLELPLDIDVEDAIEQLNQHVGIKYTEPDYLYDIAQDDSANSFAAFSTPNKDVTSAISAGSQDDDEATLASTSINDTYASKLWALDVVGAYNAWDVVRTEKAVSVAVIDTGVHTDHEDLSGNIVATYNAATEDDFGDDSANHGSHVAGIVAATCNNGKGVAGLSYNAGIVAIDVSYMNSSNETVIQDSKLIKAYQYIIDNASTYNIRVANMSLGRAASTSANTSVTKMIDRAQEAGIITICASGNQSSTATPPFSNFPSDYETCVSVINIKRSEEKIWGFIPTGKYTYERADSSNYGDGKDISAPGTDIYSTTTNGNYESYSGTSMASPYVAALSALIFTANPSLTVSQCKDILYSTATDMGDSGYDTGYGWGMINAEAAVKKAKSAGDTHLWTSQEIDDDRYCKLTRYTCTYCGDTYDETVEHTYTSEVIQTLQGCTQDQITRYTCSTCGYYYDETVSAPGHQYSQGVITKEATCGEAGTMQYTCTVCGDSYDEEIPATGEHTYEAEVTEEATCGSAGSVHYKCKVCGDSYDEEIPATGNHTYDGKVTIEPTCVDKGSKTYTCSVCGDTYTEDIEATGVHTYTSEVTTEPTCTDSGTEHYTCSVCGYSYDKTLQSTGHNYEPQVIQEQTCTLSKITRYMCTKCDSYYDIEEPALGHNLEFEVTTEPTCTDTGTICYKCTRCDYFYTATISAKGHNFEETITKQATCTESGTSSLVCSGCGMTINNRIPATGHSYTSEVVQAKTCEKDEITRYTCACGYTYDETVKTTGHSWSTAEVTKPATCGADGEKTYTCSVCKEVKTEVIPATGEHNYISEVTKKPTCAEAGRAQYTCLVCGDTYEEVVEPLGHSHTEVVTKAATCAQDGEKTYTCSNCGDVYTETIAATGKHSYTSKVTEEPTCEKAGIRTYTCKTCGNTYTKEIPAKEHAYTSKVTKKATCLEDGETTYTCSNCGDTYTEPIASAGAHKYVVVDSVAATCVKDGYTRYRCSECGETYDDVVKATGEHDYDSAVTKEPTCVDTGERTYTCSVCGATKTEVIEATGKHTYETQTKEATCTQDGYKKSICTVCGDVEKEDIIPALEHSYVLVNSKDATCVEDGYKNYRCSKCGDTHSDVTKATGHKFGEPQVTREPGCVDAGERTYTCSVCNETKTEVIEATGHTDNWTVVKEPKLGYTGKEENHCKTCNTLLGSRDVDSLATWNRLAGESRYDTAAEIASEYIGDSTCDYVIIASGENFPDALASSYASGMLDAPIILTSSGSLSPQSKQQIQNSGATKAIIIGGDGAISSEVKSQIEDIDNIKEVTRIAGGTRISTAEEIYKQVFKIATGTQTSKTAILASANNYPDALSASPISYVEHSPIFLTGTSSLENSTLEILTSGDFDEVIIAGGTGAISSSIENKLENAGLGVTRLSGTSRYDTCLAIANYALDNNILTTDSIAIASGNNFPDALAGAALCGKTKSILLITDKADTNCENSNDVSRKLISNSRLDISNVYLFGGTGAVPTDLENFLRGL